jgi:hypothetical protein
MSRFDDDLRRAVAPLAGEPLPEGLLDEALDPATRGPRWPALAGAATAVLLVAAAAGIGLGGLRPSPISPSASPQTSDVAVDGIMATDEEGGIRLTLTLDRDSAMPGQRVWADVTIENIGSEVLTWSHAAGIGCEHPASVRAGPPDGMEIPYGRSDWSSRLDSLKRELVRYMEEGNYRFRPEELLGRVTWSCFMSRNIEDLVPGGVLTYRAAWDTATWQGMPMTPGEYRVEAAFLVDGRGDYDETGSRPEVNELHRVSVPFTVTGPDEHWISAGLAMDAILADARLLELNPVEEAGHQELRFIDGVWVMHLYARYPDFGSGVPVEALVARVDGRTSEVLGIARDPDVDALYPGAVP